MPGPQVAKPWERRLRDLSQLLKNCATTYFEPELFRMNINQFLQTARTVTFIIQKNKASIRDYGPWYDQHVIQGWHEDTIMQWAKDARNVIEKEGDLELNSTLRIVLLFSYLEEQDWVAPIDSPKVLHLGIKRIVRYAQKKLPTAISENAALKIERTWIADSLPAVELLLAIAHVYSQLYRCCRALGNHLDLPIDARIPHPSAAATLREEARRVSYIKLHGMGQYEIKTKSVALELNFEPPAGFRERMETLAQNGCAPTNLRESMGFLSEIAQQIFTHYGNHAPKLFVFDAKWRMVDMCGTEFEDQADKYIFWRSIAERVATSQAHAIIWIAEAWIRDAKRPLQGRIREMPIVGENLHVTGFDRTGKIEEMSWDILRESDDRPPRLRRRPDDEGVFQNQIPYFFVPLMRAMKIPDPKNIGLEHER